MAGRERGDSAELLVESPLESYRIRNLSLSRSVTRVFEMLKWEARLVYVQCSTRS